MTRNLADIDPDFKRELEKFQVIEAELQKIVDNRGQVDSQLRENKTVKAELEALDDSECVYKLTGPLLAKQDKSEALSNVNDRIARYTESLKALDESFDAKEKERGEQQEILVATQNKAVERLRAASSDPKTGGRVGAAAAAVADEE